MPPCQGARSQVIDCLGARMLNDRMPGYQGAGMLNAMLLR